MLIHCARQSLILNLEMEMPLKTITEFDLGVGSNFTLSQRVGSNPRDVSKPERDFILWLMLEQEFYRAKVRLTTRGRVQHDGGGGLEDEDDGEDDNHLKVDAFNHECKKLEIAKKYADDTLQAAGIQLTLKDLSENHRHRMLIQLCRSCDLMPGVSLKSAPDVFRQLHVSKFRQYFDVKEPLGRGGFGEVYHVISKEEPAQEFAIKKTSVTMDSVVDFEDELNLALNESSFLKLLKGHKRIVQLYDYWLEIESSDDKTSSFTNNMNRRTDEEDFVGPLKFYIQLEFCGESLEVWKERQLDLPISQLILLSYQIFEGLAFIHRNNIMHLDINPRNILWKDSSCQEIKIVDFGLAVRGSTYNDKCGTPPYVAPDRPMTPKSDVYSAAVTIVEIAKRVRTKQELVSVIKAKDVSVGVNVLDKLLSSSIDVIATNRPSAMDIKEELDEIVSTEGI